jgi:dTDP-4-amino-4,6-dideoxygalactose transaminase
MTTPAHSIPYVNVPLQHAALKEELLAAIAGVIEQGQFILGPQVEQFEQAFAQLCGTRFALGVNSGTDALVLALRALGIGPGDEVITAPNSFVASATAVVLAGARPVFVDVAEDYNLDSEKLEAAITPRTRAIIPVHLTGRPCDMDAILRVARAHGLAVVEDCAQAVLAEYRGRRVGSFGELGCFSLHPLKTLNACGDGGVITTNDPELHERLKVLRNIGLRTRDDCLAWSGNSRLDTMQAAILLVKLRHLASWTERRRENARFYQERLARVSQVQAPMDRAHEHAVYHTFVIQAERREELRTCLAQNGIGTAVHYPTPIHLTAAARGLGYGPGSFPVSERLATRILSLPVYPELTRVELEQVVGAVSRFYKTQATGRAA